VKSFFASPSLIADIELEAALATIKANAPSIVPMKVAPTLTAGAITGGAVSANYSASAAATTYAVTGEGTNNNPRVLASNLADPVVVFAHSGAHTAENIVGFMLVNGANRLYYVALDKPLAVNPAWTSSQLLLLFQQSYFVPNLTPTDQSGAALAGL